MHEKQTSPAFSLLSDIVPDILHGILDVPQEWSADRSILLSPLLITVFFSPMESFIRRHLCVTLCSNSLTHSNHLNPG